MLFPNSSLFQRKSIKRRHLTGHDIRKRDTMSLGICKETHRTGNTSTISTEHRYQTDQSLVTITVTKERQNSSNDSFSRSTSDMQFHSGNKT